MYISTHQALVDFCQRAREFDAIAVDTEFLRERTFHPRLCLVQIATPAESVAVDPLVIDDLSPLAELMADESVTKVFHACSQDMEVMLHTVGVLPRPIFDTQVAAAFLGERQQISYGALVQTFCGVSLPKTESLTDWSRRPLTDKQIEYAIDDVKYLIVAYTEMMSRLRELGRVDWVLDELRPLADESHYRADRHEAFRKVKRINSCSRHQLGIARELAAWREDRAERRNIPRKWVMSDDTLLALVRPAGPACHTGAESCFFNPVYVSDELKQFTWQGLYELIEGRKTDPKEGSYTTYLFDKGLEKILKKVGEESTEVIIAGAKRDKEETIYEISDLAYHVMVLMIELGISVEDITKELEKRHVIDHKVKQERMQ